MFNNEKVRLLIEITKANPNIDVDQLMALAAPDVEPSPIIQGVSTLIETEATRSNGIRRNKHSSRSYTKQENDEVIALYKEFGCVIPNIPKNRVYGLANKQDRTYKAIESRLYGLRPRTNL